ncbi:MAG: hypothetical protein MZW92_37165 [Comamonadaceae bacterium]|nr:hypothetical protein [Comamonadaceae bacterium]
MRYTGAQGVCLRHLALLTLPHRHAAISVSLLRRRASVRGDGRGHAGVRHEDRCAASRLAQPGRRGRLLARHHAHCRRQSVSAPWQEEISIGG